MIIRLWQADFLDYSYHRHILRFPDFQQKRFFSRSQAPAWERGKKRRLCRRAV